ncbi:methyltransferase domain-containing protein [Thermodesulfovibrio sp.]|uniref:methyltransferase domain-containing protein n=1 Tax=Thermodesulfovibrio sp. TaxID=2067987 RepID=UPI00309DFBFA
MKKFLIEFLICPVCLPFEVELKLNANQSEEDDVVVGFLFCEKCGSKFRISDGVAIITPDPSWQPLRGNKYETPKVVSSYLWSHYGDLLNDKEWLPAYSDWASLMERSSGISLDIGCAVGRFVFDMAGKSDFSVGIDLSFAFIKTAREIMKRRGKRFELTEEGLITREAEFTLPESMKTDNTEFIVADALRLPFRRETFSKIASLNILDKVPIPFRHLEEINRVAKPSSCQLLISDPYSWSEEVASQEQWLGGKGDGRFYGYGHENVAKILENVLVPPWKVEAEGVVNWKIRNHRNHAELIKSLYTKAQR